MVCIGVWARRRERSEVRCVQAHPAPARQARRCVASGEGSQAAERLALGPDSGPWEYVVCNETGHPYAPRVLSRYWRDTVRAAGIRHIKLHAAARHTCATLMHLDGGPTAVIAAWIGHKGATLTMKLYAHSQDDALKGLFAN